MKLRDKVLGGLMIFLCAGLVSCQKELHWEEVEEPVEEKDRYDLLFNFENYVGDARLELNTMEYRNAFDELYTVKTFKYYISNIELVNSRTGDVSRSGGDNDYFLVDAANVSSLRFIASFEEGSYDKVRFLIGVDSARNVSGAQTGALDPANGMFWTWNTGYVMAKLEGNSDVAATPNQEFTYHIGGFQTGESALRTVELDLGNGPDLIIDSSANGQILISTNISKWFSNIHQLPIAQNAFIHSPGDLATRYADNYADMFTLVFAANP